MDREGYPKQVFRDPDVLEPNYGANAAMAKGQTYNRVDSKTDKGLDALDGILHNLHSSAYQLETKVDGLRARLQMTPVYDIPLNTADSPEECPEHRIHGQLIALRKLGARIDRASAQFDTLIDVIS
jgi:hypothetical protein